MRKTETLRIILELVTILSNIVIGVTVLTFIIQRIEADKSYIGSIILAIGATEMVDFLSMRDLVKRRNILNAVVAGISMAFGLTLLFLKIDINMTCILWGSVNIGLQVVKIINAAFNMLRQPLLNSGKIILSILISIFSIFLIVKTTGSLQPYLILVGIALLVEATMLMAEFIIHRYQK